MGIAKTKKSRSISKGKSQITQIPRIDLFFIHTTLLQKLLARGYRFCSLTKEMLTETIDDTMRLPLVISDGDAGDENDNSGSSSSTKRKENSKLTQTQQILFIFMTALVIIEIIISYYVNIKEEVLVGVMVDGGDEVNMIVFSTRNAIRYCYLFLGLAGFFFFESLNRTSKKRFQLLTLLLLFCHVMLIIFKTAVLF